MRYRTIATATGMALVVTAAVWAQGQQPNNAGGQAPAAAAAQQATVETADVGVVYPDRYAVPVVLEPNRRIFLMAPSDGVLKSVSTPVGTTVREAQEIAQLDRAEATAKLKIANANVKEAKFDLEAGLPNSKPVVLQARLEAAEARAELAQLELDRCSLRAPFPGKVLAAPVSPGQYVTKGNTLAELADYAILKVLVPVDRTAVKPGADIELFVEGKAITGKVMALVPLPENYVVLRELATPWAAAWVNVANPNGALEPGQRVRGPFAPLQPITAVPTRALRTSAGGEDTLVQVVRFNNVLDIPVKVIGDIGFDRTQVSGPFLPTDAAIVESSIPMVAGTVIRFNGEPPVSGAAGTSTGSLVDVTPPVGAPVAPVGRAGNRVAPIGSPDANVSKTARPGTGKAAAKGTTKGATPAKPATAKPAASGGTPF